MLAPKCKVCGSPHYGPCHSTGSALQAQAVSATRGISAKPTPKRKPRKAKARKATKAA